jgi:hypothetical protein
MDIPALPKWELEVGLMELLNQCRDRLAASGVLRNANIVTCPKLASSQIRTCLTDSESEIQCFFCYSP